MKIYSNVNATINDAMSIVLDRLAKDGILTQEKADEVRTTYAIVCYEKGFWGDYLDKLFKTEDKGFYMRIVKLS